MGGCCSSDKEPVPMVPLTSAALALHDHRAAILRQQQQQQGVSAQQQQQQPQPLSQEPHTPLTPEYSRLESAVAPARPAHTGSSLGSGDGVSPSSHGGKTSFVAVEEEDELPGQLGNESVDDDDDDNDNNNGLPRQNGRGSSSSDDTRSPISKDGPGGGAGGIGIGSKSGRDSFSARLNGQPLPDPEQEGTMFADNNHNNHHHHHHRPTGDFYSARASVSHNNAAAASVLGRLRAADGTPAIISIDDLVPMARKLRKLVIQLRCPEKYLAPHHEAQRRAFREHVQHRDASVLNATSGTGGTSSSSESRGGTDGNVSDFNVFKSDDNNFQSDGSVFRRQDNHFQSDANMFRRPDNHFKSEDHVFKRRSDDQVFARSGTLSQYDDDLLTYGGPVFHKKTPDQQQHSQQALHHHRGGFALTPLTPGEQAGGGGGGGGPGVHAMTRQEMLRVTMEVQRVPNASVSGDCQDVVLRHDDQQTDSANGSAHNVLEGPLPTRGKLSARDLQELADLRYHLECFVPSMPLVTTDPQQHASLTTASGGVGGGAGGGGAHQSLTDRPSAFANAEPDDSRRDHQNQQLLVVPDAGGSSNSQIQTRSKSNVSVLTSGTRNASIRTTPAPAPAAALRNAVTATAAQHHHNMHPHQLSEDDCLSSSHNSKSHEKSSSKSNATSASSNVRQVVEEEALDAAGDAHHHHHAHDALMMYGADHSNNKSASDTISIQKGSYPARHRLAESALEFERVRVMKRLCKITWNDAGRTPSFFNAFVTEYVSAGGFELADAFFPVEGVRGKCRRIIGFIDATMAMIDAPPRELNEFLGRLGHRHFSYGVQRHHFVTMKNMIMAALQSNLGMLMTSEIEDACNFCFDLVIDGMVAVGSMLHRAADSAESFAERNFVVLARQWLEVMGMLTQSGDENALLPKKWSPSSSQRSETAAAATGGGGGVGAAVAARPTPDEISSRKRTASSTFGYNYSSSSTLAGRGGAAAGAAALDALTMELRSTNNSVFHSSPSIFTSSPSLFHDNSNSLFFGGAPLSSTASFPHFVRVPTMVLSETMRQTMLRRRRLARHKLISDEALELCEQVLDDAVPPLLRVPDYVSLDELNIAWELYERQERQQNLAKEQRRQLHLVQQQKQQPTRHLAPKRLSTTINNSCAYNNNNNNNNNNTNVNNSSSNHNVGNLKQRSSSAESLNLFGGSGGMALSGGGVVVADAPHAIADEKERSSSNQSDSKNSTHNVTYRSSNRSMAGRGESSGDGVPTAEDDVDADAPCTESADSVLTAPVLAHGVVPLLRYRAAVALAHLLIVSPGAALSSQNATATDRAVSTAFSNPTASAPGTPACGATGTTTTTTTTTLALSALLGVPGKDPAKTPLTAMTEAVQRCSAEILLFLRRAADAHLSEEEFSQNTIQALKDKVLPRLRDAAMSVKTSAASAASNTPAAAVQQQQQFKNVVGWYTANLQRDLRRSLRLLSEKCAFAPVSGPMCMLELRVELLPDLLQLQPAGVLGALDRLFDTARRLMIKYDCVEAELVPSLEEREFLETEKRKQCLREFRHHHPDFVVAQQQQQQQPLLGQQQQRAGASGEQQPTNNFVVVTDKVHHGSNPSASVARRAAAAKKVQSAVPPVPLDYSSNSYSPVLRAVAPFASSLVHFAVHVLVALAEEEPPSSVKSAVQACAPKFRAASGSTDPKRDTFATNQLRPCIGLHWIRGNDTGSAVNGGPGSSRNDEIVLDCIRPQESAPTLRHHPFPARPVFSYVTKPAPDDYNTSESTNYSTSSNNINRRVPVPTMKIADADRDTPLEGTSNNNTTANARSTSSVSSDTNKNDDSGGNNNNNNNNNSTQSRKKKYTPSGVALVERELTSCSLIAAGGQIILSPPAATRLGQEVRHANLLLLQQQAAAGHHAGGASRTGGSGTPTRRSGAGGSPATTIGSTSSSSNAPVTGKTLSNQPPRAPRQRVDRKHAFATRVPFGRHKNEEMLTEVVPELLKDRIFQPPEELEAAAVEGDKEGDDASKRGAVAEVVQNEIPM